jgi:hypothetical protein
MREQREQLLVYLIVCRHTGVTRTCYSVREVQAYIYHRQLHHDDDILIIGIGRRGTVKRVPLRYVKW